MTKHSTALCPTAPRLAISAMLAALTLAGVFIPAEPPPEASTAQWHAAWPVPGRWVLVMTLTAPVYPYDSLEACQRTASGIDRQNPDAIPDGFVRILECQPE